MKNFTFLSRTVLAGLLVALLTVTAQAQTHFGSVNGSAMNDTWTLYLTDVNLDTDDAANGDELAVFDGSTLVAVYEFDGSENFAGANSTDYPVIAFSELNSGTGYTSGNAVTFKFWDSSAGIEYTGVFDADNTYDGTAHGNDGSDYYESGSNTPTFPTGFDPYSYINLTFTSGASVSGNITLNGSCGGDVTQVLVEASLSGTVMGSDYPDSNGDYQINGLANAATDYDLTASLADYDDGTNTFTISGGNDVSAVNASLDAHIGGISGTVTDAVTTSAIIDGSLTVELYDADDNIVDTYNDTDNDGDFEFADICVDEYYLVVKHDNYTNETGTAFNLNNGDALVKDFALDPLDGSISGTVKKDDDGAGFTGDPLEGAWVKATNYNADPAEQLFYTTTNASGNFSAADVPAGAWYVVSGGTIGGVQYNVDSVQVIVTANTATSGVEIELNADPGSIEGVVRSSTDASLIGSVNVEVFYEGTTTLVTSTTTSGAAGYYEITGLDPDIYDLVFSKTGFEDREMDYVNVNSGQTTTVNAWMVEEPGDITLTETNSITGATVKIGDSYTATDNNDGTYDFTDIPVGTYDITVTHSQYHTATVEDVQVTSGATAAPSVTLVGYNWDEITGGNTIMPIWTIYLQTVTLDDNGVEAGDEISIWDGGNMVGVYHVESGLSSGNATNQDMTAYSDITGGTGYTAGDSYTFKLYDQSTSTEFTSPTVTLSDPNSSGAYEGNVFPSGMSPFSFVALSFQSDETQTFNLSTGYQLISSRVLTSNMDMGNIMDNLSDKDNNLDFVKDENGLKLDKVGNPASWVNNIGDWKNTEGHLVKMNADDSFDMTGTPVSAQTEIPLNNGFSIVSYLPETSMNAATAFAGVKNNLVFVRNSEGKHYWKIGGSWVNNIGNLNPGEGYFVKTSAKDTLIYPSAKGSAGVVEDDAPQYFTFEGGDATEPVYTIYIKSDKLQAGDEIAAYDGDVMVGATVVEDPANENVNDLNLFSVVDGGQGYEAGNKVSFKVWSPRTNEEYTNIDVEYVNPHGDAYMEDTFPAGEEQYSIVKASVTELDVPELQESVVKVYPNPATNNLFIKTENDMTQIRVLNTAGQVIMTKQVNAKEFTLNVNGMDAGIYILQTTFESRQSSLRFAVQ